MRSLRLVMLAVLGVSAQADTVLVQDVGGGNISFTSTSARFTGSGISAPAGMTLFSEEIPDFPGVVLAYPGTNFIADTFFTSTVISNQTTSIPIFAETYYSPLSGGPAICDAPFHCLASPVTLSVTWDSWINNQLQFQTDEIQFQYVGPTPMGTISGRVFSDLPDYPTRPGLQYQTIELLTPYQGTIPIETTQTDSNGEYFFAGLPPGTYEVIDESPRGVETFPGTNPQSITLAWDQNVSSVDIGEAGLAKTPESSSVLLLLTAIAALGLSRLRKRA